MTYLVLEICANRSKLIIKKNKELRYPERKNLRTKQLG